MSWTRPPTEPPPPGRFDYGGPKPEGYDWPPGSMSLGAFLVCKICGGAVSPNATEQHDAWHLHVASIV